MNTSKREKGFYWVKWFEWTVMEWNGEVWMVPGYETFYEDDELKEINENRLLADKNDLWTSYTDYPLPILRGPYLVYGTINKGTEHETKSKFFAHWQGDVFTDKDGEDLTGINDSVEYWFDHSLIPDPV